MFIHICNQWFLVILLLFLFCILILSQSKLHNFSFSYIATLSDWCVINRWGPTWLSIYKIQRPINRSRTFCALGMRWLHARPSPIISGHAIETDSLLGAVDVCFKAFSVFDINYTKLFSWVIFQPSILLSVCFCHIAVILLSHCNNPKCICKLGAFLKNL